LFIYTVPHPEILRPLENVTIPLKKTATLSCLALSYGALKYDWKRLDGSRISSLASQAYILKEHLTANFITVAHQLTIPNIQLSDEGWYCCVATNTNGNSEKCVWLGVDSKSLINFWQIHFKFIFHSALPTIVKSPTDVTVRGNSKNTNPLSCSATGLGPIHYQWEKYLPSDRSWMRPSNRAVNITSPKLIFSLITEEDEGVYHCIVANDDGSVVSDNATITVYGECSICAVHCIHESRCANDCVFLLQSNHFVNIVLFMQDHQLSLQ